MTLDSEDEERALENCWYDFSGDGEKDRPTTFDRDGDGITKWMSTVIEEEYINGEYVQKVSKVPKYDDWIPAQSMVPDPTMDDTDGDGIRDDLDPFPEAELSKYELLTEMTTWLTRASPDYYEPMDRTKLERQGCYEWYHNAPGLGSPDLLMEPWDEGYWPGVPNTVTYGSSYAFFHRLSNPDGDYYPSALELFSTELDPLVDDTLYKDYLRIGLKLGGSVPGLKGSVNFGLYIDLEDIRGVTDEGLDGKVSYWLTLGGSLGISAGAFDDANYKTDFGYGQQSYTYDDLGFTLTDTYQMSTVRVGIPIYPPGQYDINYNVDPSTASVQVLFWKWQNGKIGFNSIIPGLGASAELSTKSGIIDVPFLNTMTIQEREDLASALQMGVSIYDWSSKLSGILDSVTPAVSTLIDGDLW